jgi:hypothetical protein
MSTGRHRATPRLAADSAARPSHPDLLTRDTRKSNNDGATGRVRDPRTRTAEERARREREQIDNVVRKLDELRIDAGLSKYELGRRTHYHPMTITKLLTTPDPRPTLLLIVEIAEALGATVEITPARPGGVDLAATFIRELLRRTMHLAALDTGRDLVVDDEHLDAALHHLIAELAQTSQTSGPTRSEETRPRRRDADGSS